MRNRSRTFAPIDLEILVGLADGKTQGEIGTMLRLEQPAISKHLRAAEKRAGIALVHQDGRRVRLTSTGRYIADAAKVILTKLSDIDIALQAQGSANGGFVRIIACSTPGAYVLPTAVARFLQLFPEVRVDIDVRPLRELWRAFNAGAYDFAIVPTSTPPADVWIEPLYHDPIVVFANPSHRLATGAPVHVRDLENETLIGRFTGGYWQSVFRGQPLRSNRIENISLEGTKRMVETGLGIGVLFQSAVQTELAEGRFRQLPIAGTEIGQVFCLAWLNDHEQTPVAQHFGAFLLEHLTAQSSAEIASSYSVTESVTTSTRVAVPRRGTYYGP